MFPWEILLFALLFTVFLMFLTGCFYAWMKMTLLLVEVQVLDGRMKSAESQMAVLRQMYRNLGTMYWRSLASVGTALEQAHQSDMLAASLGAPRTAAGDRYREQRDSALKQAAERIFVAPLPRSRASSVEESPAPQPPAATSSTVGVSFSLFITTMVVLILLRSVTPLGLPIPCISIRRSFLHSQRLWV